jgi:hypothetical protein
MSDDNNTLKRARFNHKWGMLSVFAMIKEIQFIHPLDGYSRTASEQNALYNAGKSKCDGYVKVSMHQLDRARDIVIVDDKGNPVNKYGDHPNYAVLGKFWEDIGGRWGGNFTGFRDIFHFEY